MNLDIRFYWSLLLRRLPVMTGLFLLCAGIAAIVAVKLPPTYSTSARLLVEPPKVQIDSAMQSIGASEQLQVIEQRLLTRANLIDIAQKRGVFEDMDQMTPDLIESRMRAQTRIRRTGGRGQATLMTISFEGRTGRIVANVVNDYVTLVLEANSEFRVQRAEGTLTFFQQEVARLDNELEAQSARIVEFKNRNADALPDDLAYRQNRQSLLQERLGRLERDKASIENQRSEMISVFEATGRLNLDGVPQQRMSPAEAQLDDLKAELEEKLAVFSETHPRVTLLKNRIAQLEARLEETRQEETRAASLETATDGTGTGPGSGSGNAILDITLAEMDQRLEDIDQDIATTRQELERLEASIAATPANAVALESLQREYENIQRQHSAAVNNLNQARMGERIEVTSQGQRITTIENANVPQVPSGPARMKLAAMGVAGGLGLASAYFLLLELLNRKFRRPAEFVSRFDIVPITTIPYIESRSEKFWRRTALVGAFVFVLISVPTALYLVDTHYMPLEILTEKILQRLRTG